MKYQHVRNLGGNNGVTSLPEPHQYSSIKGGGGGKGEWTQVFVTGMADTSPRGVLPKMASIFLFCHFNNNTTVQ